MALSESEKTEVIYCRVSKVLKKRLENDAEVKSGEAEAVIVRRALNEYFDRRDHPEKYPARQETQHYQANERAFIPPAPPEHPGDESVNSKTNDEESAVTRKVLGFARKGPKKRS